MGLPRGGQTQQIFLSIRRGISVRILSLLLLSLVLGSQTFASEGASRSDQVDQVRAKIENIQSMRTSMAGQLYNISDEYSDPQMYLGDYLNRDELQAKKKLVVLLTGEEIDLRIQYMNASAKYREMNIELNEMKEALNRNFDSGSLSGSAVLAQTRIVERKQDNLDSLFDDIADIRSELSMVNDEIDELNLEIQQNERPARKFNNLAMK